VCAETNRPEGLALVESLVGIAVTAVILTAVYGVLSVSLRGDETLRTRLEFQLAANRAAEEIVRMLKMSGPVDLDLDGSWEFPNLQPAPISPIPAPPGGPGPAAAGGPSWNIFFRVPEDLNGDGDPTDALGILEWDPRTYSFERNEVGGIGEVRLRAYDGQGSLVEDRVLARHVTRLLFQMRDGPPGEADPGLGLHEIRVRIWFERAEMAEQTLRHQVVLGANMRAVQP